MFPQFDDIGNPGTMEFATNMEDCLELARNKPIDAARSSDNIAFLAEEIGSNYSTGEVTESDFEDNSSNASALFPFVLAINLLFILFALV